MVAMWANTIAWSAYGYLTKDPYVIAANEPGLLLAIFMTTVCYGAADPHIKDRVVAAMVAFGFFLSTMAALVTMAIADHDVRVLVW